MPRTAILVLCAFLTGASLASAQSREEKVQNDRKKVEKEGFWIYNDLAKGLGEAKKTGKPLLVVLRCIPCEACVKLDDDLVDQDKRVRPLLERFVCVRLISTNGLDLSLFQFDTDQSFAVFLLNADGAIYGRFGTRSHRTTWSDDVSIEGLSRALQGALELHEQYPRNKADLAGKRGPAPEIATPEKYPLLRDRYGPTLAGEGKVVPSCIHCHQIGDAQRHLARSRKQPISEQILFPHPHPRSLGLILDPREKATVLKAEEESPAARAGFQKGDVILKLQGQPLLSIADVQWVLHQTPAEGGLLKAEVKRGDREMTLELKLTGGWRRLDNVSWRASSWGLRRMGLGGMLLEALPAEERKTPDLASLPMALRVKHLGRSGPHGAAYQAGFRMGDVLIGFDERTDLPRESDVFAHVLNRYKVGERVPVTVLREGKKLQLVLPMQE